MTLTQGFWMGVHEVTQAEYVAVIESNPSFFQPPTYTTDTNRPVERVSWHDAVAYCAALTTIERGAGLIPPTGSVTDPQGPDLGSSRVVRGGSWGGNASILRCAQRNFTSPSVTGGGVGFRAVLAPGQ